MTSLAEYSDVYVDSVRFIADDVPYRWFEMKTDEIDFIRHQSNTYKGSSDNYQEYEIYLNFDFACANMKLTGADGSGRVVINSFNPTEDNVFDFDVVVDNVVFDPNYQSNWMDYSAVSGQVTFTGTKDNGTTTENWAVIATMAADGTASISADNGTITYEYSMVVLSQ
jgi:hypothetical protein